MKIKPSTCVILKEEDEELHKAEFCKGCGEGFRTGEVVVKLSGLARKGIWTKLRHLDCMGDSVANVGFNEFDNDGRC